ncbi:hypothetical protein Ae201684_003423 [Aphanomyces euteiches]|uniref:Tryptophan synthase beta chain-like PALP domain-containing protein n=1 Tax=Aphanomyces euteiches TaxID=100861 RepID=A0A6G0XM84_9STRA|nr:hypothetical protein Ae201684_003423 [Aphanomyces euteiches]KAH9150305.1 hypothetical protein AeRB84_006827 [Aphanomyces euteiches]KAH9150553.1 hypothetical protein AeRB84_006626 [Aphanomyces euteiches]
MSIMKSPMQQVRCRGWNIHVKRDDFFFLSGNKFRKLFWLTEKDPSFFAHKHLLSYGGIQSNAMLAIAQLAQMKDVPFAYFTKPIPPNVHERTASLVTNLSLATSMGMRHVELSHEQYDALANTHDFTPVVPTDMPQWIGVPQGVAIPEAELGIQQLAHEINDYTSSLHQSSAVVLPCGTGTTAYYLAKHVHPSIKVYGIPCVGSATYLRQQLDRQGGSTSATSKSLLQVLEPKKRVAFGTLWRPLLDIYEEVLSSTGIELDLIYGCLAWHTMLLGLQEGIFEGRDIIYIHCGGVTGNASQLDRYRKKYGHLQTNKNGDIPRAPVSSV